jgi:hypothetical protein
MRFTFGAIAIALLLVFVAAGCGKKKSAAVSTATPPPATTTNASTSGGNTTPTTTSDNTTASGGSTTSSGKPKFALTKDCAQLLSLGQKVSAAVQATSGSGDTAGAVAKEVDLFKQLAAAAPSDIRPDFETFATAFAAAATALQKAHFTPGQTPNAKQLAELQNASKSFSSAKVQAASKHLEAWGATHCGGLTTTG